MPKLDLEALNAIAPELYKELKAEEEATAKELNELRVELNGLFDKLKKAQQPEFDVYIPNAYSLANANQHCKLSFDVKSENVEFLGDTRQLIVDELKCEVDNLEKGLIETQNMSIYRKNINAVSPVTNITLICTVMKISFLKNVIAELESIEVK